MFYALRSFCNFSFSRRLFALAFCRNYRIILFYSNCYFLLHTMMMTTTHFFQLNARRKHYSATFGFENHFLTFQWLPWPSLGSLVKYLKGGLNNFIVNLLFECDSTNSAICSFAFGFTLGPLPLPPLLPPPYFLGG